MTFADNGLRDEAMTMLRETLEDLGYGQLYGLVAGGALFVEDRTAARVVLESLPANERALVGLFALAEAVPSSWITRHLAGLVDIFCRAGLASSTGGAVRSDDLVVVPALRGYLLTATPPGHGGPRNESGRAYIGDDSLRLARALPDPTGRRVLDLGTGCGVQGLLAARGALSAVLTDVEERSLEVARLNRVLNAVRHDVEILSGDCYEPVGDARFDLVVALPPYVPSVEGTEQRTISGGPDGLGLLRRVLFGAPQHLLPGGELILLAQLLCDDDAPLLEKELDLLAPGCDTRVVLGEWHPLQPYALELAKRLAESSGADPGVLLRRYMSSFRDQGVTGVATAFLRLRAPGGSKAAFPKGLVTSRVPRRPPGQVLAPAVGLRFGEDRSLRSVQVASGASHMLQGHVAGLLAGFDGHRTIAEAVALAWGRPEGADEVDLVDQALERIGDLERAGLLAVVEDRPEPGPVSRL